MGTVLRNKLSEVVFLELLSEEPVKRTVIRDLWRYTEVRGQLQHYQMLNDKSNDEALGQWIGCFLNFIVIHFLAYR